MICPGLGVLLSTVFVVSKSAPLQTIAPELDIWFVSQI